MWPGRGTIITRDSLAFGSGQDHRIADHADDDKSLLSLLPDTEYTSLVHCVFDFIFYVRPFVSYLSGISSWACLRRSDTGGKQPKGRLKSERKLRGVYASSERSWKMLRVFLPSMLQKTR
ncbi:hypothetical protein F4823DRAFT_48340 [Ustulina deusta]|nr:hypothetical protein F4823DRAFT_48340 [Ustulina deusta]